MLFASPASLWTILLGAIGAMLPDPLQFVHARFPHEPLRTFKRFHRWAHTGRRINGGRLGVGTQAAHVVVVVTLATTLHRGILGAAFAMVP